MKTNSLRTAYLLFVNFFEEQQGNKLDLPSILSEIANNSSNVILSDYNWNSQTKGHPFYWYGKIQDRPPSLPGLFSSLYDQRRADFDLNTSIFLSPLIHTYYLQYNFSHGILQ